MLDNLNPDILAYLALLCLLNSQRIAHATLCLQEAVKLHLFNMDLMIEVINILILTKNDNAIAFIESIPYIEALPEQIQTKYKE